MDAPGEWIKGPETGPTAADALKLIWEWRRYRNEVFWTSVYRYGAAILLISLAPYVLPGVIGRLGRAVLVFPAAGSFLALFASWLTAVQYKLYKQVDRRFRSMLGAYDADDIPASGFINRKLRTAIGKVIAVVFLFLAVVIEPISALILAILVGRAVLP
jgi:hypothetical protein